MNFIPVILTSTTEVTTSGSTQMIQLLITFVPILLIFYFLIVRPQKKREKEEKEMRQSISIGDEIVTIGGIIGLVVRQNEDTLIIETGGDRSKLRIQKTAVRENITAMERRQAAAAEEKKEASPEVKKNSKSDQ